MNLEELRARKGFICDMDGVIYLGNQLLPGVREFVSWLNENGKQFLFLTTRPSARPRSCGRSCSAWAWTSTRSISTPVR